MKDVLIETVDGVINSWVEPLGAIGVLVQDLQCALRYGELTQQEVDTSVDKTREIINSLCSCISVLSLLIRSQHPSERIDLRESVENAATAMRLQYKRQFCIRTGHMHTFTVDSDKHFLFRFFRVVLEKACCLSDSETVIHIFFLRREKTIVCSVVFCLSSDFHLKQLANALHNSCLHTLLRTSVIECLHGDVRTIRTKRRYAYSVMIPDSAN